MKQTYTYEVNGFQIHAEYEEKTLRRSLFRFCRNGRKCRKKREDESLYF